MKLGKFVRLSYTGTLENGEVFDSTDPKVIKDAHGPVTIILGAGHLIKGLEKAVLEMEMGEERELDIPPGDGFGTRDPKKIKFLPTRDFVKEKVTPYPGLSVTIDGQLATIKSVSSGRVLVDFNHPLSGRKLHYRVKLLEEVKGPKTRISEVLRFHFGKKINFRTEGDKITLENVPEYARERLRDELTTYTPFKNIRFVTLEENTKKGEENEKHGQGG